MFIIKFEIRRGRLEKEGKSNTHNFALLFRL